MPDLLTDLTRVRELMARAEAGERVAARAQADAYNFLRTHASGIEAMARDAERYRALAVMPDQEWVQFHFQDPERLAYGPVDRINRKPWLDAAIDAMKEAGRD